MAMSLCCWRGKWFLIRGSKDPQLSNQPWVTIQTSFPSPHSLPRLWILLVSKVTTWELMADWCDKIRRWCVKVFETLGYVNEDPPEICPHGTGILTSLQAMPETSLKDLSIAVRPETSVTFNNVFNFFAAALLPQNLISMPETYVRTIAWFRNPEFPNIRLSYLYLLWPFDSFDSHLLRQG